MKIIPVISSIFLMGSLAAETDPAQYISIEVPTIAGKEATVRAVIRGTDGTEVSTDEIMVIDVLAKDDKKKVLATITIPAGQSSGSATVASKHLDSEIERSALLGSLRLGDTGLHAGELSPTPAATAAAN